jgi:hypothetical protein
MSVDFQQSVPKRAPAKCLMPPCPVPHDFPNEETAILQFAILQGNR